MEPIDLDHVSAALMKKGYAVSVFDDKESAAVYLDNSIDGRRVGLGDSLTLEALAIYERLVLHNQVFEPSEAHRGQVGPGQLRDFQEAALETVDTEIFLASVNGIAASGELVNIDRRGNRVAGTLFGHEKVYIVAGVNKIAPTLEDAIWRARNIAAPQNARRLGYRTPCAATGDKCYDCNHAQRICCGLVVHLQKMCGFAMEIVLIKESLGL